MTDHEYDKLDSEFGKGTAYNLGLFLAHQYNAIILEEQYLKLDESFQMNWPSLWFNGAADHMYDLIIPKNYPLDIQERLSILQTQALSWRDMYQKSSVTKDDVWWAIGEAKELLRLIDEFHGIKTVKGTWE